MQHGTKKARGRGRPPAYDRASALAAMRGAFWRRGFSATSLDALSAATQMGRPSLYGAFGDKRAMYLAILESVAVEMRAAMTNALSTPRLVDALRAFYAAAIAVYTAGAEGPLGCPILCTASVEAPGDEGIRSALSGVLHEIDKGLAARFARARSAGELSPRADPAALGRLSSSVLQSLALRARAGERRAELEKLAEQWIETLRPWLA